MKIDIQHRTRPLRIALAAWVVAAVAAVLPLAYWPSLRGLFLFFVLFGAPSLAAAAGSLPVLASRRRGREGSLVRRGDVLEIERGGKRVALSLRALDGAWREGPTLVLSFRGNVVVRCEAGDEAESMLAALGFGSAGRAATLPIGAPVGPMVRAFFAPFSMLMAFVGASLALLAILSAVGAGSGAVGAVCLVLGIGAFVVSMLLARATLGSSVVVGADGVWVRRGVVSRYVPFTDEEAPRAKGRRVYLGGTELCAASSTVEANELVRQLSARRGQSREVAQDEVLARALDRGDSLVAQWAAHVRQLAAGSSYRDRAVTDESLASIVEDGREPPDRRAAAALALGARGSEQAKHRVRVAAVACAHPKLRVSLEAAAEGELDDGAIRAVERSLKR